MPAWPRHLSFIYPVCAHAFSSLPLLLSFKEIKKNVRKLAAITKALATMVDETLVDETSRNTGSTDVACSVTFFITSNHGHLRDFIWVVAVATPSQSSKGMQSQAHNFTLHCHFTLKVDHSVNETRTTKKKLID